MGRRRWADIYIKGVSVRFGFDILRISQILLLVKNKATRSALWDVYIQVPCWLMVATKALPIVWFSSGRCKIYNIIVGLSALLVSTNRAIQSLYIVERVTDGSTFLFCILSYAFTELMNCPAPMEPRRSKYDLCHGNMKRTNLNQLSLAI